MVATVRDRRHTSSGRRDHSARAGPAAFVQVDRLIRGEVADGRCDERQVAPVSVTERPLTARRVPVVS
jgi:hypothetical protein